jgi:hypothetical protein
MTGRDFRQRTAWFDHLLAQATMSVFSPSSVDESLDCEVEPAVMDAATPAAAPTASPNRRRAMIVLAAAVLGMAAGLPAASLLRGTGVKTTLLSWVGMANAPLPQPSITASRPAASGELVPCDAFIAADITLPNGGHVIDPATLNAGSVRLLRKGERTPIAARVNTSAAGDALVLTPEQPLDPNTTYRFEVLPALKDTAGAPFKPYTMTFTTASDGPAGRFDAAFEKIALPASEGHLFTGVCVGPDGCLYACTYDGLILRYTLTQTGEIAAAQQLNAIRTAYQGPRLITGICFDPTSTADAPVLYVSHGQFARGPADDWTGKLSRLSGATFSQHEELITGLPRASRDHLNNQITFGPDGALYLAQGSNTAMGAADAHWGNRPERLLSAAVLRIDLAALPDEGPLDVKTADGGTYDPAEPGAPVTVYSTGVRNAFDLAWHRNGQLYATINGSAAGGNTPADPAGTVPALTDLRVTVPDHLARLRPGSYHGHPNPVRGQYVLMGGNPSAAPDGDEVPVYPVGTRPDAQWTPPAASFGRNLAPCGMIEYRRAGSPLDGALLVCRYSGGKDICVMRPSADGSIAEMLTGIEGLTRFADPLDLAQHPSSGHLYVAEMGGKRLTLVRVKPGVVSGKVFRQSVPAQRGPIDMPPTAPAVPAAGTHAD